MGTIEYAIELFKEEPIIMTLALLVVVAAIAISPYSEESIRAKKAALIHQRWKDTFDKDE